jgi:hypothetical protein
MAAVFLPNQAGVNCGAQFVGNEEKEELRKEINFQPPQGDPKVS